MEYILIMLVMWPVATILLMKYGDFSLTWGFDIFGATALGFLAAMLWPLSIAGSAVAFGSLWIVRKLNETE